MQEASPYPIDYTLIPATIAVAVGLAAITAGAAALLPARQAVRSDITTTIAYD